MSRGACHPDLSLVIAVGCVEETVGREVRHAAKHLRELGRSFEIVAVNDGCRDNSLSLLALVQREVPELTVLPRDTYGRAMARAVLETSAETLVMVPGLHGAMPWAPLGFCLSRLGSANAVDGVDAVIVRGRYVVARRATCLPAIVRASGRGSDLEARLEREARDLRVEVVGRPRSTPPSLFSPVRRLVGALVG